MLATLINLYLLPSNQTIINELKLIHIMLAGNILPILNSKFEYSKRFIGHSQPEAEYSIIKIPTVQQQRKVYLSLSNHCFSGLFVFIWRLM